MSQSYPMTSTQHAIRGQFEASHELLTRSSQVANQRDLALLCMRQHFYPPARSLRLRSNRSFEVDSHWETCQ